MDRVRRLPLSWIPCSYQEGNSEKAGRTLGGALGFPWWYWWRRNVDNTQYCSEYTSSWWKRHRHPDATWSFPTHQDTDRAVSLSHPSFVFVVWKHRCPGIQEGLYHPLLVESGKQHGHSHGACYWECSLCDVKQPPNDAKRWRCTICKKKRSVMTNAFFKDAKVSIPNWLRFITEMESPSAPHNSTAPCINNTHIRFQVTRRYRQHSLAEREKESTLLQL